MMTLAIRQQPLSDDVRQMVTDTFARDALEKTGLNGRKDEAVSFISYDGDTVAGVVVAQLFWGQLHIKNLVVAEPYRGRGLATELLEHAHDYGRVMHCTFAFVETMSFQAADFYGKLGYAREFERTGFAGGTSFIYMKKDLT